MRKLILSINVSIDGFADHTVAIGDDEMHYFYVDRLNELDAVLFGRVTYQLFEDFWPIAPADPRSTKGMVEYAHKINTIPKVVFSKTLQKVHWNNSRLVNGSIEEEVSRMKQRPGKALSVSGISVSQALMKAGLIDEYWLLIQPVVWGGGKRLFENSGARSTLRLVEMKAFKSGVVALHYLVNGKEWT